MSYILQDRNEFIPGVTGSGGSSGTTLKFKWEGVTQGPMILTPNETRSYLDVEETGLLHIAELHSNSRQVSFEITLFGDQGDFKVWKFEENFLTLLKRGWGLAPGDVKLLPGDISPDPVGNPNPWHPYLLRYKDSTEADSTSETGLWYSAAYTPQIPMPYKNRLRILISNPTSANVTVRSATINRMIITELPASP